MAEFFSPPLPHTKSVKNKKIFEFFWKVCANRFHLLAVAHSQQFCMGVEKKNEKIRQRLEITNFSPQYLNNNKTTNLNWFHYFMRSELSNSSWLVLYSIHSVVEFHFSGTIFPIQKFENRQVEQPRPSTPTHIITSFSCFNLFFNGENDIIMILIGYCTHFNIENFSTLAHNALLKILVCWSFPILWNAKFQFH